MYVYFETQKTVNTVKHFWNTIVLQRKSQLGLRKQNCKPQWLLVYGFVAVCMFFSLLWLVTTQ